ncbi:hypothetical protein BpHYR1_053069 [Brachionus plicatilis]|uniref:Uncharacterized protein n=1 Tax=Brachionus plicatilis TaxID=10195 RepID=A0A3M7PT53_BRAPC|nr:hypothetical protein BpHYR1_053069 [Brachionus plicatilis]
MSCDLARYFHIRCIGLLSLGLNCFFHQCCRGQWLNKTLLVQFGHLEWGLWRNVLHIVVRSLGQQTFQITVYVWLLVLRNCSGQFSASDLFIGA